jgi:outer membrane biosynthesis protein TonB
MLIAYNLIERENLMNRVYKNTKNHDIVIPSIKGSLVVIPGNASIELHQWYDRYVPGFLSIVKQTTTKPAVKVNQTIVPKPTPKKVQPVEESTSVPVESQEEIAVEASQQEKPEEVKETSDETKEIVPEKTKATKPRRKRKTTKNK